TQIWIGRSPCRRMRSRCSRTFRRDGFGFDAEGTVILLCELHVTYHEQGSVTRASWARGFLYNGFVLGAARHDCRAGDISIESRPELLAQLIPLLQDFMFGTRQHDA